jgi:hypothetical protein
VRTTITLDSDVDQMLKAEMRRSGATFRQAVNQAIRRGLADSGAVERKAFRLRPRRLSLRQGIDPAMLQHFEEDLEIETFLGKTRKLAERQIGSRRQNPPAGKQNIAGALIQTRSG